MRFFSPLVMKIMGAIGGGAAAASAGGAGVHFYSQSRNKTTPPDQVDAVDPFLAGKSLGKEQIEMAQFLWKNKMGKELIDYEARDSWIKKAKEKSLISEKWPGDIIFISDKSDPSLARLLRDKCYLVSRWFLNTDQTLDDRNEHLKKQFKNAKDSFKIEHLKDLCSTGKDDTKNYSITSANPKTLNTLLQEHPGYTCKDSSIEPEDGWMKDIYDLKKENRTGSSNNACTIVRDNIIIVITYGNGSSKKYEIRKSQRKTGQSGGYISVPREDWIFYPSLEDLPGFPKMFKKNK